eukprot:45184_1
MMLSVFKKRKKFSKENLEYQCGLLSKNIIVNAQNQKVVISTLQQISELMIWGDQNDETFFDVTTENRIFDQLLSIIKQQYDTYVTTQVLQTLSIIIQNVSNTRSLYHLFSNNYINELILYNLDFTNPDLLGYYIILLRQISSKLDGNIINFFFNSHTNDFALYMMALKFFKNENPSVRTTVMQIILNVLRVCTLHHELNHFITNHDHTVTYLSELILFIKHDCFELNHKFISEDNKFENAVQSHIDHYYYLADILSFNLEHLSQRLIHDLLSHFIVPVLLESLTAKDDVKENTRIDKHLSLFILAEMFIIFSNTELKSAITICLMDHNPPKWIYQIMIAQSQYIPEMDTDESKSLSEDQSALLLQDTNIYKNALFHILTAELTQHRNEELMVCVVSLILRMVNNDMISMSKTLIKCGICPQSVHSTHYPHDIIACVISILAKYNSLSTHSLRMLIELLIVLVKDTSQSYNGLNEIHYNSLSMIWKSIQNELLQYLQQDRSAKIYLIDVFEEQWNMMQQQPRIESYISNPKRIVSSISSSERADYTSRKLHKLDRMRSLRKNAQSLLYFLRIKNELLGANTTALKLPFTARRDLQYYNELKVPILTVASGCISCFMMDENADKRQHVFFSTREPDWLLLFNRVPNHTGFCLIHMAVPIHMVEGVADTLDGKIVRTTVTSSISPHKMATKASSNKQQKWTITLGFGQENDSLIALDYITMNRLRVRRRMIHKIDEIMNHNEDEKNEEDEETDVTYNV